MTGTVLAFDFGERRIGVAVGESALRSAHPLQTIDARDNETRFATIGRLIEVWQPGRLVVGLPAPDRADHPMNHRCRKFARQLEGRFGLAADLVDETCSSVAAEADLSAAGVAAARRKAVLDSVAAQTILQTWFERQPAPSRSSSGRLEA
ncbi:MAG: Holliday junction resolvase RuvX [Burkholderiales bacterium]|jgi:putative Holliday junction resolvase|nr:Holliday junction resolvase RuvX [Betaproteobacteria bacterium]